MEDNTVRNTKSVGVTTTSTKKPSTRKTSSSTAATTPTVAKKVPRKTAAKKASPTTTIKKKVAAATSSDRDTLGKFRLKLAEKVEARRLEEVTSPPPAVVVPPPPPPPPPPKVITISEFIKERGDVRATDITPVRIVNTDVPSVRYDGYYGTQSPMKFPEEIEITYTYPYVYNASYQITADIGRGSQRIYLPGDFKIIVIEGKELDDFVAKSRDKKMLSLENQLAHSLTIGSDPEIFVEDDNGSCVPAFLFLPGKDGGARTPNTNSFAGWGGMPMYWDGFQAEFTTRSMTCLGQHMDSIAAGIKGVYDAAKAFSPKAKLSLKSVFEIPQEVLDAAEDEHVEFGCMPSFNVYGLKAHLPPARMAPFRSAGGHIHFGVGLTTEVRAAPMVKALDAILGVMCVSLFAGIDDPRRRQMYGLPGEYRTPPHGIEYRPLSNAWLCHPVITNLVIDLSRKALVFGKNGFLPAWKATEAETIACMIECNVDKAHEIMERNKSTILKLFKAAYSWANDSHTSRLYQLFYNGVSDAVRDPTNFVSNWALEGTWVSHGRGRDRNVRNNIDDLTNSKSYRA